MIKRSGAGSLSERITFQVRGVVPDGYGNDVTGPFADQFIEPARLAPRLGSEPVIAARLTGVQPFLLTVRSSTRTRQITPAWRAVNARTGVTYNIKAIVNPDERNQYLELLVVQGEPS
ncbi:head-tail adaptor protein [Mesorhizobium sp. CGMCC 1.15528]|uniref:Head-tail adaptor protein n=1 Tax=Mesorhizobium zhangyense TaxID=1776730 RepID=A0A7C9RCI9_9HYPH|nr:head-tail adaptor protein [Mesorhizobium zhangyense]NGN45178.1 head-tail adaptor protein [Mesorhizobium zhangyense]